MQIKKRKDKMKKIIIEDNIPLPEQKKYETTSWKYKHCCFDVMSKLEVGQSFLIYGRSEASIKCWFREFQHYCDTESLDRVEEWRDNMYKLGSSKSDTRNRYLKRKKRIESLSVYGKDLSFEYSVIKSEKPILKYDKSFKKEVKQYPIRVWRIK